MLFLRFDRNNYNHFFFVFFLPQGFLRLNLWHEMKWAVCIQLGIKIKKRKKKKEFCMFF